MESLKEEALYEAILNVRSKAKNLAPFELPEFVIRSKKEGICFSSICRNQLDLPRIDENIKQVIDISNYDTISNEDENTLNEKQNILDDNLNVSKITKQKKSLPKKKSNKRRYDIDLIS